MSSEVAAFAAVRRWGRAFPTLLRVGIAETIAYRVEFVIWMMTNSLPLIMLGLWSSVASEGPFGRFGQRDFVAYYLAALIVRNLTGTWIVWQLNEEIRSGSLKARLLRPMHPFISYIALHLSSVPLRAIVVLPFTIVMLVSTSADKLPSDPLVIALLFPALLGGWVLSFFIFVCIGALSFFLERSIALFEVFFGMYAVLSGYLVPVELLPGWAQAVAAAAPFRYMLGFPVEAITGGLDRMEMLEQLGIQWVYAGLALAAALLVWRSGLRRYEAYGG